MRTGLSVPVSTIGVRTAVLVVLLAVMASSTSRVHAVVDSDDEGGVGAMYDVHVSDVGVAGELDMSPNYIVCTMDGRVESFDIDTGMKRWSVKTGDSVIRSELQALEMGLGGAVTFIPSLDGGLFGFVSTAQGESRLHKFPIHAREVVEASPLLSSDGTLFLGSKTHKTFTINALTGSMVETECDASLVDNHSECPAPDTYLGPTLDIIRSDYEVTARNSSMASPDGSRGAWHFTVGHTKVYQSSGARLVSNDEALPSHMADLPQLVAHMDGTIECTDPITGAVMWARKLESPVVSMYTMTADTLVEAPMLFQEQAAELGTIVVGKHGNQMFVHETPPALAAPNSDAGAAAQPSGHGNANAGMLAVRNNANTNSPWTRNTCRPKSGAVSTVSMIVGAPQIDASLDGDCEAITLTVPQEYHPIHHTVTFADDSAHSGHHDHHHHTLFDSDGNDEETVHCDTSGRVPLSSDCLVGMYAPKRRELPQLTWTDDGDSDAATPHTDTPVLPPAPPSRVTIEEEPAPPMVGGGWLEVMVAITGALLGWMFYVFKMWGPLLGRKSPTETPTPRPHAAVVVDDRSAPLGDASDDSEGGSESDGKGEGSDASARGAAAARVAPDAPPHMHDLDGDAFMKSTSSPRARLLLDTASNSSGGSTRASVQVQLMRGGGGGGSVADSTGSAVSTPSSLATPKREQSRFNKDFEILGELGHGGFGHVLHARNCLDGLEYAVKKIRLPPGDNDNIKQTTLREVKYLARLHHAHIVRYYNSWMEKIFEGDDDYYPPQPDDDWEGWSDTGTASEFSLFGDVDRSIPAPTFEDSFNWDESHDGMRSRSSMGGGGSGASPSGAAGSPSSRRWRAAAGRPSASTMTRPAARKPLPPGGDWLYIQMQYCKEGTLRDLMNRPEWVPERAANRSLFAQVVKGLAYVHEKGFIHRDLKPSNIFLDDEHSALLGDFGLSKGTEDSTPQKSPTNAASGATGGDVQHTTGVGSPLYCAPEQRHSTQSAVSEKSDIFSLGVVYFELCHRFSTGHERLSMITHVRTSGAVEPNGVITRSDARFLSRMLSSDPTARPTAAEVLVWVTTEVEEEEEEEEEEAEEELVGGVGMDWDSAGAAHTVDWDARDSAEDDSWADSWADGEASTGDDGGCDVSPAERARLSSGAPRADSKEAARETRKA